MTTSSLTKKWRDAFVIELRLRGADGKQIGDELAQVESHCLDAGVLVDEAFGEPVAYARSVVISRGGESGMLNARYVRWLVLRTLAQVVGLMSLLNVVPAVRKSGEVTFTGVDVVLVLVLTVLVVVLVARSEAVLRFVAQGSVLTVGFSFAVLTGLLVLVGLIPSVFSVTVPTLPAALIGAALLVLPSLVRWPPGVDDDAIVEPLAEDQPPPSRRGSAAALQWFVPAVGVVLCAVRWLVP
ncbi:hypothetical protein SAMN05216410_2767 [Sanguibacter gelidistatuariae]|uniref:Uncharacterized protein n=1 Tax=Sanguibacter gelidistatuariae TaxID=1814289 RepID=A0A1G6RTA5_9MICO|nr:hypothetical protein [Sanguibacter gelidistatuariae]SDD07663.1 hypothetical protein SAMN05216410_2767 [Sanguibacter gelidistatuariae]